MVRLRLLPYANLFPVDFDWRWRDSSTLREYKVGWRQWLRGFKRWQLLATALDWRTNLVPVVLMDFLFIQLKEKRKPGSM